MSFATPEVLGLRRSILDRKYSSGTWAGDSFQGLLIAGGRRQAAQEPPGESQLRAPPPCHPPHNTQRRKGGKALITPQTRQLSSMDKGAWHVFDPLPKFPAFPRWEELHPKYLLVFPRAQLRGPKSKPGKSGEYTHSHGHTLTDTHSYMDTILRHTKHTLTDTYTPMDTHTQTHTLIRTHTLTDTHRANNGS